MTEWLAVVVFALTFAALAARRIGRVPVARGPIAIAGGLLMLAVGAVTPLAAVHAIDLGTLALLVGMMLLAGALGEAGFFRLVAAWLVRRARDERRLVWTTLVGSAVLSGLFLNDTVALLLPAVLVVVVRRAGLPAFRTLAACALGVNIGGLWTPVGTPQNAYLAQAHGLDFAGFALHMTPLVLFGLLVAGLALGRTASRTPLTFTPPPDDGSPPRFGLTLALGALTITLTLFVLSGPLGLPLWSIALTAGLLVLALMPITGDHRTAHRIVSRVNGNLLLMFTGLFVLLEGATNAGLVQALFDRLPLGHDHAGIEIAQVTALTFLLSNVFSNVPAVLLLDAPVSALGGIHHAELLAAASTLAGNTTLLASAATLIVAEAAEAQGERFPFWRFTRIGIVVSLVTVAAAVPYLWWLGSA